MTTPQPQQPAGGNVVQKTNHTYVLIDRSGSMESIASDVIGGFNALVAEQQANGPDAKITVIQFDSQDPAAVMVAGIPVLEMTKLDRSVYQPRGGTPLLDATGMLIGRIRVEQEARKATGLETEDVVFVTITDGQENQSREYNLARINQLVEQCKAEGWTFVYVSADPSAYHDAAAMGYDHGSTTHFSATPEGAARAMRSTARGLSNLRDKKRRGEQYNSSNFFETGKDAEDDK
jgi:Mg-chelatase subunit ChlD